MAENYISDEKVDQLIQLATKARENAYAPYSGYKVGAALLAESGAIYEGVNIEMVIYRTTHAERFAIDVAVKAGERKFLALAVVTDDPSAPYPCGQCLQDLTEFDVDANGDLEIIAANLQGIRGKKYLRELLPERFGPANLDKDVRQY